MKYIDVKEASERWGISDRRIRLLCNEGRIDGAIKLGWSWTIPEDTPKPRDGRVLRHFRNLDIRAGFIDQEALDGQVEKHPLDDDYRASEEFSLQLASTLCYLLDLEGRPIGKDEILSVFSGRIVDSLSLEAHLIVTNFRSCMLYLSRCKERWTEKDIRLINARLMQGIDDMGSACYRSGLCDIALRGKEKLEVAPQMETIFTQYESWSALNPLVRGVMLYGEIGRCRPFDGYPHLLSYLVLSGELMANGIRPPVLSTQDKEEAEQASFIAYARGNYRDLTAFIEARVMKSYSKEAEKQDV